MKAVTSMLIVCLLGSTGCASSVSQIDYYKSDTATLQRVKPMRVIDLATQEAGDFRQLGKVNGIHCRRIPSHETFVAGPAAARRSAIDQVKLRAAALGATHIATPRCEVHEGMDLANSCYASITCESEALVESGSE